MEFRYDADADVLFIPIGEFIGVVESEELAPGILFDFDEREEVVGITVMHVRKQMGRWIQYLVTRQKSEESPDDH